MWTCSSSTIFFATPRVVGYCEAAADEKDVTYLDISTLRFGADVQALSFGASGKGGERNTVCFVGVMLYVVLLGVSMVVEEDTAAAEAVV